MLSEFSLILCEAKILVLPYIVFLTGSNTASNTMFIKLQTQTAVQVGLSPVLLACIQIEDVCGKPFELLMDELIFEPLHMKNSTFKQTTLTERSGLFSCGHNKKGEVVSSKYPIYPYPAASGLWTTPTDLAILLIEVINALKGKSKIGLSESKAKELITSQGCKEWAGLAVFLDGSGQGIEFSSLGWGIGFQCMLVAYPYLETGVVIMTNTDLEVHQMKGIIGEIIHRI
ncbi:MULTISPECIES: serine hydrolase domain-containing protein [unclassified Bacillus (in: firmicutes)]|uniref:serine hydrolase domain-containing protein n=1 Tax=Bacillus sp. 71mf TaxID=1761757 RepID=UPI001B8C4181